MCFMSPYVQLVGVYSSSLAVHSCLIVSVRFSNDDRSQALFRPIAMMIPDYALIAEIMLFSEGFSGAKSLAQKVLCA